MYCSTISELSTQEVLVNEALSTAMPDALRTQPISLSDLEQNKVNKLFEVLMRIDRRIKQAEAKNSTGIETKKRNA